MEVNKKCLVLIVGALVFLMASVGWAMTYVTIGTGGVGGTWYPLGGAISEVLTNAGIDVKATSRATGASQENCRLVASGRIQMGMAMGIALYQATTGTGQFEKDGKLELRTLMHMYSSPQHLVTTVGSGIKTLDDLRGKRVVLGSPGSGDEMLSKLILTAAGIDPEKDIKKETLTMSESTMALKDGNIDAVFWNIATPGAAYLEVAAVRDLLLISIPDAVVKKIVEQNPFLLPYTIKAGTYDKQDYDVHTVADGNYLTVSPNIDEKLAYNIVKTIIENKDKLTMVTKQAENFVPKKASIGIIPFSTGAAKYFSEFGITVKVK